MGEKRCGDCEYFVAFRNMNYETCTCDTITEYCELLQNEDTYDRDKGDDVWNNVFDDCPLKTGYVSTESAILLLQSEKEVRKQFDNYVRISCEKKKKLQDENEQLRERLERINGGYGHLTHRNGLTANEWLIESQEKELKKKNEQISDLKEENEQLKQQIKIERKWQLEKDRYYVDLHKRYDNLEKENERLRQMIKENVFGRYVEGSLADLEFKAIAYDDIVKLEVFNELEPKVVVICKRGKKENVRSFCQMFVPFAMDYEIKELEDE